MRSLAAGMPKRGRGGTLVPAKSRTFHRIRPYRKAKLPTELFLMVTHTASILGVMQVSMALLCLLFATCTSDKGAKKLVIFVCLCSFAGIAAMQFHKPAGTGAEGSPATGPLPLLVGIMVPSLMGLF